MGDVLRSVSMREDLRGGSPIMARARKVCAALELPDELFTSIVTRLHMPVQTIFQLRCVCKAWNTSLDKHFVRYFFQLLSQTPLYIVRPFCGRIHHAACDIRIKSWHTWLSPAHSGYFSLCDVRGDAGDWLLVKERSDSEFVESLFLANPKKRSFRKLPTFPEGRDWVPYAMGVGLDESSKSCKVFAVDQLNFYSHKVYLYDFELDSWKAFGAWQMNDGEWTYGWTFYEGALHCIIETLSISNVCRFDERSSRWEELPAQISGQLCFQGLGKLFVWQGHLMLIGGRGGGQLHESRLASVHIWQLDKKNQVWVESMRMPDHLVDHFYVAKTGVLNFDFDCATCNDQICVTSTTTVVKRGENCEHRSRHVMCDLFKALWWDVPEPPFLYRDYSTFSVLLPKVRIAALFRCSAPEKTGLTIRKRFSPERIC